MKETKTANTSRPRRGPLVTFIRMHYGTSRAMADELGVTPQTVSNWLRSTPLQMLKHMRPITDSRNLKPVDVTRAVLGQLKHIQQHESRQN